MRIFLIIISLLLAAVPAVASIVDATQAEAAYRSGDYVTALELFEDAADKFRNASTNSEEPATYREAAYIYDRMANCSFTQRNWDGLKHYTDGLLVVSISERNLCETRLAGALESGISMASARFLSDQLDESVRLSTVFQLKRSLALILYESAGEGPRADEAIKLFQQLAGAMMGVVEEQDGAYTLDVRVLDQKVDQFDAIFDSLEKLGDMDELWDKYPPGAVAEALESSEPGE